MARRGGKAASRRSRRKQRAAGTRPAGFGAPSAGSSTGSSPQADSSPAASPEDVAETGDAFELADARVRAATAPPMSSTPLRKARAADPRVTLGGTSRLTERALAEYHYVGRDLRNIAVLMVVLAVLLAVATFAVNTLGIGRVS
ncbi:MAG: hypothetical protein ABJC24_01270 [Chloroflexota bacterium]